MLVLSGAGDDFCPGGDRTEFADRLEEDPTGRGVRVAGEKARRVCEAISGNRAVTMARVQGKAIGGGLALACDLRVGAARVRELILIGRAFDSAEAQALSVLQRVVPENELDQAVEAWAKPVVRRPEAALRVTKAQLNSYAAATRMADPPFLDAELMASLAAAGRRTPPRTPGPDTSHS